jgi:hypothetical protein
MSWSNRTFAIAALTEFVSFFIIVLNTRAFTHALIGWTMLTDALFITQSFLVSKWMVEDRNARGPSAFLGFLIGGELGSVLAILLTTKIYGV